VRAPASFAQVTTGYHGAVCVASRGSGRRRQAAREAAS